MTKDSLIQGVFMFFNAPPTQGKVFHYENNPVNHSSAVSTWHLFDFERCRHGAPVAFRIHGRDIPVHPLCDG